MGTAPLDVIWTPSATAIAHVRTKPVTRDTAVATDIVAVERAMDGLEIVPPPVGGLPAGPMVSEHGGARPGASTRRHALRYTALGHSSPAGLVSAPHHVPGPDRRIDARPETRR